MRNLLVVDIETMDGENYQDALAPFISGLAGKTKRNTGHVGLAGIANPNADKYELALKKNALSPVGARIACIGVAEYDIDTNNIDTTPIIVASKRHFICDDDEKFILRSFNALLKPRTEFVTFNGREFDFPFIMFRAGINRATIRPLPIYPYNGKDAHYDMKKFLDDCSLLSNLDSDPSLKYVSLKKWIEYFGIRVDKPSIKDGEISIKQMFQNDRAALSAYVAGDIKATWTLYLQFQNCFESPYFR